MDKMAFACEVKLAGEEGGVGTVDGYASLYNIVDRGGDILLPGAFKETLAKWRSKNETPPMLWQHDSWQPVGIWTDLVEDERGLKVSGELILDVPQASIARALIRAGAVKGLSIGYRTVDYEIDRSTGIRKLKKVALWEISLVTFPMLPEAQISGVKSVDERLLEQALRDEGLSNREAKLAVSVVRKQFLRDGGKSEPPPRDGAGDVLMSLRKAAQSLR